MPDACRPAWRRPSLLLGRHRWLTASCRDAAVAAQRRPHRAAPAEHLPPGAPRSATAVIRLSFFVVLPPPAARLAMTEPDPKAPVAFGFSKAAAKKAKVAVNVIETQEQRQLITGVQGSKIQAAEGQESSSEARKIIPKQANTYRVGGNKFTPSFKPPASDTQAISGVGDKFEAAPEASKHGALTSFGLDVRAGQQQGQAGSDQPGEGAANGNIIAGLAEKDVQQLKEDLKQLPDEAGMDVSGLAQRGVTCAAVQLRAGVAGGGGRGMCAWLHGLRCTAGAHAGAHTQHPRTSAQRLTGPAACRIMRPRLWRTLAPCCCGAWAGRMARALDPSGRSCSPPTLCAALSAWAWAPTQQRPSPTAGRRSGKWVRGWPAGHAVQRRAVCLSMLHQSWQLAAAPPGRAVRFLCCVHARPCRRQAGAQARRHGAGARRGRPPAAPSQPG